MARHAGLIAVLLLAAMLVSCAKAPPEPVEAALEPGDEVDGMLFASIAEMDWDISLAVLCDFESVEETGNSSSVACFASPGDRVFFGNCDGIAYDTPEEADKLWQDFNLEVTFDGQKINLPAFGFLDVDPGDADGQQIRFWNLMVERVTPGAHAIECLGEQDGAEHTRHYALTVAERPGTLPALSADVTPGLIPHRSEKAGLDYLLYVPDQYGLDPQRTWPLILYLHGLDRANSSISVLHNDYGLKALLGQDGLPAIVAAPQGEGEYEIWATDEKVGAVMTLLDEIQTVLAVDPSRIYLTGSSAGGNGTWEIGVRHPGRFAALVPVMGYYGWPFGVPDNICDLKDVPIWAFHGEKDEVVPLDAEAALVEALKECGGDVRFTVYEGAGHNIEGQAYGEPALDDWLLSQTLE